MSFTSISHQADKEIDSMHTKDSLEFCDGDCYQCKLRECICPEAKYTDEEEIE